MSFFRSLVWLYCPVIFGLTQAQSSGFNYAMDSFIVPSVGQYNYIGCYLEPEAANRALKGPTYQSTNNSVDLCAEFCNGYTYFGVEGGNECFCGDSIDPASGRVPCQDECYQCCAGDLSQRCGGYFRLGMYELNGPPYESASYTNTGVCTYNGPATEMTYPVTTSGTVYTETTTSLLSNKHTMSGLTTNYPTTTTTTGTSSSTDSLIMSTGNPTPSTTGPVMTTSSGSIFSSDTTSACTPGMRERVVRIN